MFPDYLPPSETRGPDQSAGFLTFPLIHWGVGLDRWASCQYCGLRWVYVFNTLTLLSTFALTKTSNSPFPKKKKKSLVVCVAVALGSLMASRAGWQRRTHSVAGRHWKLSRGYRDILREMLIDGEFNICACAGHHNWETNRQWKRSPCPGILLGLLIDRTSHGAILHWSLPGKVPLFLWENTGSGQEVINKCQRYDRLS